MKKTFITIFACLIAILTLMLTACGGHSSSERGYAGVDEAKVEFEKMCISLMEYAKNVDGEKVDRLVKCYPDGFDECTYMSIFDDYNNNGFSDYLYYVIPLDDKGEYYFGGIINYSTNNNGTEMTSYLLTISFLDGCCKIDCCSEAAELASNANIYPDGMKDAESNGRLARRLNESNLSFAAENAFIDDIYIANTYCIWQNKDGSLDVAVSFKNGTNEIRNIKNVTITVVTKDGDEVVVHEEYVNALIEAKTTMNHIAHISAESLNIEIDTEIDYMVFIQYENE